MNNIEAGAFEALGISGVSLAKGRVQDLTL